MRCAQGDHAIGVDLNFSIVGPLVIVLCNNSHIMHVEGVERNGGLFGHGGGGDTATLVGGF